MFYQRWLPDPKVTMFTDHGQHTSPPFRHSALQRIWSRRLFRPMTILLFVLLHATLLFAVTPALGQQATIRVGILEDFPKLHMGKDKQPSGILGELLTEMAKQEGWVLQTVPCDWQDCLKALQDGRIDLLPDVARNQEREALYDFHEHAALHSWSPIYALNRSGIQSVLDLQNKRIAILAASIQLDYLSTMLSSFGIQANLVEVDHFETGFQMVDNGQADAVVANYHFGELHAPTYHLVPTSVIFQPIQMYYATGKGRNANL